MVPLPPMSLMSSPLLVEPLHTVMRPPVQPSSATLGSLGPDSGPVLGPAPSPVLGLLRHLSQVVYADIYRNGQESSPASRVTGSPK